MILKSICSGTHNQCRLRRSGVIWSYLLATKMSHAAAFRSDWSLLALTCLRAVCCVHSAIECPDYQSCTKVLMVFSVKWELLAGSLFSPVVLMAVVEFVGHLISHSVCICSYVLFLCKLFSFCFFLPSAVLHGFWFYHRDVVLFVLLWIVLTNSFEEHNSFVQKITEVSSKAQSGEWD